MPHVAHVAVRNRGTFGGSIALADPAAEMPACALSLGATLVLHSTAGRREVAATDYFQGLYQTARRPDELLVEALIPVQQPASVSVFGSWPSGTATSPSPASPSICRSTGGR